MLKFNANIDIHTNITHKRNDLLQGTRVHLDVDWGDDGIFEVLMNDTSSAFVVMYNYTVVDNYTITVQACNSISSAQTTLNVITQVPIGNLSLTHQTYRVMIPADQATVTTEFSLQNDPGFLPPPTGVSYRVNLIHPDSSPYGIPVPAPGLSNQGPANQSIQIEAMFGIEDVGSHLSKVEVFNMLLNKVITLPEPLVVVKEVSGAALALHNTEGKGALKVNETNKYNGSVMTGSDVTFTITFDDSNIDTVEGSGNAANVNKEFSHSYSQAGSYTLCLNASNILSWDEFCMTESILVQNEIIKDDLILVHPYVIDLTSGAKFNLSVTEGKPEPSDVNIEIRYKESVLYNGGIYSWPFSKDVTFPDVCEGNATIEIPLQNEVSTVTLEPVVILIKRISDSLSINGPTIWVKDTQALFTIKEAIGTHWECQINWGDMTPISTVDNNKCDANASANHTYTATGTFNVSTKCSNLPNTEDAQTSVTIISQPAVTLTSNATITKPPGTIELTFTAIPPMAPMTFAENLVFDITYSNADAIYGAKIIHSVQTISFLTTATVTQTVQDRGMYSVDVSVSVVGVDLDVDVSTSVAVYEIITGLNVTSSASSSFVEKDTPVTFTVTMATGSDYSISTTFESGQVRTLTGIYYNDTLQHSYTFSTPGLYSVSTTCSNPVSSQEASTVVIVQSQLDLDLVVDEAIPLQSGQVLIAINSSWTMTVGENVTFTVTFNCSVFTPDGVTMETVLFYNTHTYSFTTVTIGYYSVTVSAENGVDAWTDSAQFTVQEEIESLTFTHWSPDSYTDTVNGADVTRHLSEEPVYFTAIRLTGTAISACAWNFGDGGRDVIVKPTSLSVTHSYAKGGNYDVTYSCTNPIGTKNVSDVIYFGSPVGLDEMVVPPKVYLADGIAIDVSFKKFANVCMSFTVRPHGGGDVIRFWKTVNSDNCSCGREESVDPNRLEVIPPQLNYK